jgi:D-amino-acid dehydrogenase
MQTGYRLGSIMEFAGYDTSLNPRRLDLLRTGASHYLEEPTADPILEEWCGLRPMTYDSKPIIGRSPALENVYLAAGHNMLGLSMAPATGKLIAEMLNGLLPHIAPDPYSPTRF